MRIFTFSFLLLLLNFQSFSADKFPTETKIKQLLHEQVAAWNAGDLERFMQTYWNSEVLVFVGSRGPTYGWQQTLENYKKGYPDKRAMGELEFKILKLKKVAKKSVFVIGRFELTREKGNVAGHFTLVIQKIKGKWLIVSDHSSAEN